MVVNDSEVQPIYCTNVAYAAPWILQMKVTLIRYYIDSRTN